MVTSLNDSQTKKILIEFGFEHFDDTKSNINAKLETIIDDLNNKLSMSKSIPSINTDTVSGLKGLSSVSYITKN